MNILVVDDDMYSRQLMGFVLEEGGHKCEFAESGEQALEIWRKQGADVVLMDVLMPGMNGYEAARIIKEEAGQDHIPIVFLTALDDDRALVECLSIGDDFLGKPVNFVTLQAKIRAHSRTLALNRQVVEQNRELAYFHTKVQAEHEMTQHIMTAALKLSAKDVYGVRYHCTARSTFNGDLVLLKEKRDGGAYVLVGDFTGHGLAASVGSIPVAQAFSTMCERNLSVSEISLELNKILKRFLPPTMFFAACLLEINPNRSKIEVWAGGLPDAFIVGGDNKIRRVIHSAHMPLGIMDMEEFESWTEVISVTPQDRLYLYTDGITECPNIANEMFGEERLRQVLESGEDHLFDALIAAVHEFNDDPDLQDDLSLVELKCAPPPETVSDMAPDQDAKGEETSPTSNLPAFHLELRWGPEQLRDSDPLMILRQWLGSHAVVRNNKEVVFMVLAELFNNALEHGVLGLSSSLKDGDEGFDRYYQERVARLEKLEDGYVSLQVQLSNTHPARMRVMVSDSGPGFSITVEELDCNDESFGRGLPLIKALCTDFELDGENATVKALIELD
ncbi:response regulator [Hahella sp. KA22]|uniref:fused response regulator/phosphatase n=1 Tax=Hahella sp. KA22 TaxID=1628392 RepID=UPI000FDDC165|nr:fused response regulator/phosphatase [Hahella sp. KA22]AZZ89994.1 response regulator [Hahella sp. KA22]QAY53363.1 response regulator [Hahella sp. KA22]